MQHKYFLTILKESQMQFYTRMCIAIQATNIRQVITSQRDALKEFLLKHSFTRLTALTEQYIKHEKSFQLKTATTNYRNQLLKRPSIYTLATVKIDPKPLLYKGQLQTVVNNYQEASKRLTSDNNTCFEELRCSVDSAFATVFVSNHSEKSSATTPVPTSKQESKDEPNMLFLSTNTLARELSLPLVEYIVMLDGLFLSIHASAPGINISHEILTELCLVNAAGAVALWTKGQ